MEEIKKRKVQVILAGVLIIVAIVAVCQAKKQLGQKKVEKRLRNVYTFLICEREECDHMFGRKIRAKDKPPYECEQCRHQSAYRLLVCEGCGAYVPMTEPERGDNVCPYCRSRSLDFPRFNPLEPPPDEEFPGR